MVRQKTRNGKDISDFDKYTPWSGNENFSGKIEYVLDSGEAFSVFREFKKKNPQIYNSQNEEISKQFNIDKNKGNEFFYEQTGIDEDLWQNTSLVEQQDVVLSRSSQGILTQKISNILSSGDDNTSYKKSIATLNKKLIEEVGTERTTGRPINNVNAGIVSRLAEKAELERYESKKEELENKQSRLEEELSRALTYMECISEVEKLKESEELEREKIKIRETARNEYVQKIEELQKKLTQNENGEKEPHKLSKLNLLMIAALIIASIVANILYTGTLIAYGISGVAVVYVAISAVLGVRKKAEVKKITKENQIKSAHIQKEIEIINNSKAKIEGEIKELEAEIERKFKEVNPSVTYGDSPDFSELIKSDLGAVRDRKEAERKNYNDINLAISEIKMAKKAQAGQLERKALLEEEISELEEEKEELSRNRESHNKCKRGIRKRI